MNIRACPPDNRLQPQSPSRRTFVVAGVSGTLGLALLPLASKDAKAAWPFDMLGGIKATDLPAAFVTIAKDGVTTILCNRVDMGQGIETALAMICAEELDADWSRVSTSFGNQRAAYVDPQMSMHLTGGSNSVKNSYGQYRALGASLRSMLVGAAAEMWRVSPDSVTASNGMVSGGGKQASFGELFELAIKRPIPSRVALKDPKKFRLIGTSQGLTVARAKSSGKQIYGIDIRLPKMVTALIARPPVFGAIAKRFDASKAEKIKGVQAVLAVDLDRGARGVAVIADGFWAAKQGRDALEIEWDSSAVEKVDSTRLLAQFRAIANAEGKPAHLFKLRADTGAIASAPKRISAEFVFPYLNHAQMEPLASTVDLSVDRCDIYTASQVPGLDAAAAARVTGLSVDKVEVHVQMAGGGFGRRAVASSEYVVEAVNVAMALAKAGKSSPVQVLRTREDDVKAGHYRPFTLHRAEIGFDTDGKIFGWDHRIVTQTLVNGWPFESAAMTGGVDFTASEGMGAPYDVPMRLTVHHPKVNVPVLFWRSVGSSHTAFVMETLVDELAEAMGQDPVAFRFKLMEKSHPRHRTALQLAVDQSGYLKRTLAVGMHWGVAVHECFESVVAYVVAAGMRDGKPVIESVTAGVHCNLCVNPRGVEAQVQGAVAIALSTTLAGHAITLKDGRVEQSNFHDFPSVRIPDMPRIDVHIVPSDASPTGMGEPGLPPFAPALANALRRATGRAQRGLPFVFA